MTSFRAQVSIFLFCLMLSPCIGAENSPVSDQPQHVNTLTADTDHVHLNEGMYYFEAFSKMSLKQIRGLPDKDWQFHHSSSLFLGSGQSYIWVNIPLQRMPGAPSSWVMTLDWPLVKSIEWFHYNESANAVIASGQFTDWQIPPDSADEFPFAITLSLRSDSVNILYLRMLPSEKALLPVTLWPEESFSDHQLQRNWYLGLFYGVLFAMFGYNLSLFLFLRHKAFAAYCFYVATMAAYTLIMNGAGVAWLWSDYPAFLAYAYRLLVPLGFFAALMFIRQFLLLKHRGVFLNLSSQIVCYLWLAILLLAPVVPAAIVIPIIDIFGLINCLFAIGVSGYLWMKGDKSAKYLTLSWSVLIASTVILILGLNNVIPYVIELHYLQNIGVTIEALLLSMALAERINRDRKMRSEAQNIALQMSNEAAKAKESEVAAQQRLLGIERRVKEELSLKVNEQTRELKVAMQKLQIMNKELERLSLTDPLTGLANRRYFDKRFSEEIQRARRNQSLIGVLMLDIDHFKQINDTLGHQAGDHVIQSLSALIQRVSGRASDLPARIGGEEFCLLVCNESKGRIATLAESLRESAASVPVKYRNEIISYTISVGVCSVIPTTSTNPSALLKLADDALYQAKKEGRNRVVIASDQAIDS
ncbi:diguanylate cyclase [uncultured Alteromonas sp.]|uniref:sensor domain-containing diguanylate cyclase n=1 Tax=uncultured Alteromonas sp. TaxID=179113 RepID=UPI0025FCC4FC|nr:diguanylate cyclase [uncultured Alteromonas sp.]